NGPTLLRRVAQERDGERHDADLGALDVDRRKAGELDLAAVAARAEMVRGHLDAVLGAAIVGVVGVEPDDDGAGHYAASTSAIPATQPRAHGRPSLSSSRGGREPHARHAQPSRQSAHWPSSSGLTRAPEPPTYDRRPHPVQVAVGASTRRGCRAAPG